MCPNAHPDMFYQIREHGEKAGKTLSLQQQQQFVLFAVITLSLFFSETTVFNQNNRIGIIVAYIRLKIKTFYKKLRYILLKNVTIYDKL